MNLTPYETSAEGAYDLSIEAAARRIQMASQDGGSIDSSGGYSSDGELSETSSSVVDISAIADSTLDTEGSSLTENSSSANSGNSDFSDDTEDIDTEISYLKQKQQILEKVTFALKKEEDYIALNAHYILKGGDSSSKLWDEAKFFLDTLQMDTSTADDVGKRKLPPTVDSPETIPSSTQFSKRPKIDLSMVGHIRAGSFPSVVSPLRSTVVSTPGRTLDKALQFTTDAQIIALPSPPFSVVHINRAFCEFSGLDQEDVIGKTVESILQVNQDFSRLMDGVAFPSQFLVPNSAEMTPEKDCQLQVFPITSCAQETHAISHILIKINPMVSKGSDRDESTNFYKESSNVNDQIKDNADQEKHVSHQVTIG
ncbi:hypothetical protein IV203_020967 [Nitzschia inconspicua]|uniref:Uncharacterized protein n=1 Tax=Nitzschia inconspicua TaxID=303405 RepID=A0A9K3KG19_9STRA|nr:hypothetical protein IV203_020967 [Nitzschia inconspicua]